MAFLSNRVKTNECEKNVNYSESNLDENNVRVLLLKESGFTGRTLIFDSSAIDYLSNTTTDIRIASSIKFQKLTEMVFGSVSLRCHETFFRIHNLSPNRIMFTQVFPFPGSKRIEFCALDLHLSSTVKNVFYLETAPDDVTSQNSSFDLGMQLDQQLFHNQFNVPNSSTSTIDSGYVEQSFSSFVISNRSSFNSGLSLNRSQSKIPRIETNTFLSELDLYSSENYSSKAKTSSILGLVIILTVASDNDEDPKHYLKHIAFVEAVIFRIRRNIEIFFNKPSVLLSTIVEVSNESTQWLLHMFPDLQQFNSNKMNSTRCNQLNRYSEEIHSDPLKLKIASLMFKINRPKFSLLPSIIFPKKYIAQYRAAVSPYSEARYDFDKFCELLETLENKESNFFLSTIITATLTYHLGWITTCFSCSFFNKDQRNISSYNSLWRQITELYGAHGCPIKSAQTIINGSNQIGIISRVLQFIHYFIRSSTVAHSCLERINVINDNKTADTIYLKYKFSGNYLTQHSEQPFLLNHGVKSALHKSKVCTSNLSELSKDDVYEENYLSSPRKVTFLLGENEELINLKSNLTTLDSSKMNYFTEHSNSNSVLHDLCDHTKQKHLETINKFNKEHSKNKTLNINEEKVLDFDNNNQIAISYYNFEDTNKQVLYGNRKQKICHEITKMKIFSFPLPSSKLSNIFKTASASTLKSDTVRKYVPDMVVQGTSMPEKDCILKLKKDLYLTRQIYFFDGFVDESVAIVGNVDKWDVEIVSSCASINRKSIGMKLDASSLVANMLEVLLQMWNLHFCKKYSATHIEQRLLEICIRSYALGQLLLHTEMCTMDLLTATLHLEINDIPLLMSVASVISPQVTKRYGLSFQ